MKRNKDVLEEYNKYLRDKEGIDISILRERNKHMRRKEEENIKEGFNIATVTKAKIKLLIYSEKLPDGRNLILRTSLSVMNSHKHEMSIFNILTTIVSVLISMIVGDIF